MAFCLPLLLWLTACSSDSEGDGASQGSTLETSQTTQTQQDDSTASDNAGLTTINDDSFYPEGPLWLNGELFYTEYSEGRILTWDGESSREFWAQEGCGPSGLIETEDNTLLVTCYDSNTLAEVDRKGETVQTVEEDGAGEPFSGPNDFTKDSRGGIYFTASGAYSADAPAEGKVYYITPEGDIQLVAEGIRYSNGLGLTPGGDTLLVAEMLERRVLSFSVQDDGGLEDREVFASTEELSPTSGGPGPLDGPDGLKVSEDGAVYIAQNGTGRVLIVSPDGELEQEVEVPSDHVTNVAFGPSPETLYITSAIDPNNEPYPGEVYKATP